MKWKLKGAPLLARWNWQEKKDIELYLGEGPALYSVHRLYLIGQKLPLPVTRSPQIRLPHESLRVPSFPPPLLSLSLSPTLASCLFLFSYVRRPNSLSPYILNSILSHFSTPPSVDIQGKDWRTRKKLVIEIKADKRLQGLSSFSVLLNGPS